MAVRIGVLTPYEEHEFYRAILDGIFEVSQQQAKVVVDALGSPGPDQRPVSLRAGRVDGILSIANVVPDEVLHGLARTGLPITVVSHRVQGDPFPAVMFNNAQGIRLLMAHLVGVHGRRRLLFVRGIREQLDAQQREAAFRDELLRFNLNADDVIFVDGDFSPEQAVAAVEPLLEQPLLFDGIIASDYAMAGALIRLLQRLSIHVPAEVAVVGFGDAPEAERDNITTVAADVRELGVRAARQLLSQLGGRPIRGVTTLHVRLMVRGSA